MSGVHHEFDPVLGRFRGRLRRILRRQEERYRHAVALVLGRDGRGHGDGLAVAFPALIGGRTLAGRDGGGHADRLAATVRAVDVPQQPEERLATGRCGRPDPYRPRVAPELDTFEFGDSLVRDPLDPSVPDGVGDGPHRTSAAPTTPVAALAPVLESMAALRSLRQGATPRPAAASTPGPSSSVRRAASRSRPSHAVPPARTR